jgi:hypothetical protein
MQDLAKASPEGELRVLAQQGDYAEALGQVSRERDLRAQAVGRAKSLGISDVAAQRLIDEADADAMFGYSSRVTEQIDAALALSRDPTLGADAADAASAAGQDQKAESLLAEARRERPEDTFIQSEIAPRVEARSQIRHGKAAAAIQTLAAAQPYEDGSFFSNHLLRGEAYLASGQAGGRAPALAAQHDTANARTAYQDFFALWKSADPDIPVLIEAKMEYAKLQ